MNRQKQPTLFLDRDGTINVDLDGAYVAKVSELVLIPNISTSLVRARKAGYKLAIITNQAGIGKGLYTEADLVEIHKHLVDLIRKETKDSTFDFDHIEYCPHKGDAGCACRKPRTLMVERASTVLQSDLSKSFYVGDKKADMLCAAEAKVRSVLVLTGYGEKTQVESKDWTEGKPFHIAKDLTAAVNFILGS